MKIHILNRYYVVTYEIHILVKYYVVTNRNLENPYISEILCSN